jgi:transcription-repair coupling factor (superfamily II helicase)
VRLDFFGATVESIRRFDPLSQRSSVKLPALELRPVSEVMLDPAAAERFIGRFLQRFGAVTNDPMLEAVQAGRAFPGVEHWLPLFHEEVVPLTDYLAEGAELAFDHSAWEAIRARAALIGEHYEARRQPPHAGQSFGAAPYRPLPPDLLYVDEQSFTRLAEARPRWQFSHFGPPPARPSGIDAVRDLGGHPARDFATERADRSVNLFDSIVAHLRELGAAGVRPLIGAYSEGTAERLRQVLADHGFDALTQVSTWAEAAKAPTATVAVLPLERGSWRRHPRAGRARPAGRPADQPRPASARGARTSSSRTSPRSRPATSSSTPSTASPASRGWRRSRSAGRRTTASSSSTPATTSCSCRSRGWRSSRATATRRPRRSSTSWAGRAGRAGRRRSSSASASWPRS